MNTCFTRRKAILLVVVILVLLSTACLSGSGDEEVVFSPAEPTEASPIATMVPTERPTELPTETPWPLTRWTVIEAMEAAAFLSEASDEEIINYLKGMGEEVRVAMDELLEYMPDAELAARVRALDEAASAEVVDEAVEPWRMPPLDGAVLVVNDAQIDPQWEETIAMHAANLAIPAPYFYEVYTLPVGTRYADVRAHYTKIMGGVGYRVTRDDQGKNDIYLLTFMADANKQSRNAILFYSSPPAVIVLYSNPSGR